jgi:hypothetical protein
MGEPMVKQIVLASRPKGPPTPEIAYAPRLRCLLYRLIAIRYRFNPPAQAPVPYFAHCVGLFLFSLEIELLPLVETIRNDETTLTIFPGIAECRFSRELFSSGVERRISDLLILGPMRQEAPAHHLGCALAIHRSDCNEHRRGRGLIPIPLEVRGRPVELQLDFDFGIV